MTVFDKLLVDGWIKQINFKVMRGIDIYTPDAAMTLEFNGTVLRYTPDYMDDDNSRKFFEQDSYFAEFSEDSETLDEFRKDGWKDIDVSEIPERGELNTFLYWYVLFGGSMGRVYNCLDPVNSYWETEVINLMDRIPYRTNYARQYSPEEKSDPRGWSEGTGFGWISINKKDEDGDLLLLMELIFISSFLMSTVLMQKNDLTYMACYTRVVRKSPSEKR